MNDFFIPLFLIVNIPSAIVDAVFGGPKNTEITRLLLGAALGLLGILSLFALKKRRRCQTCNGRIDGSPICNHCGDVQNSKNFTRSLEEELTALGRCTSCRELIYGIPNDIGLTIVCPHCDDLVVANKSRSFFQ